MNKRIKTHAFKSTVLIALCFLLTSTGWLSWEYHLLTQIPAETSDLCTMVAGYLLQAAGIGFFAVILRKKPDYAIRFFPAALILHLFCLFPAVLSPFVIGTLVFGFLMNLFCGFVAGYYLYDLARDPAGTHKASAFGIGYGLAILSSWLLSLIGGGALYYSEGVLIICSILTAGVLFAAFRNDSAAENPHAVPDGTAGTSVKRPLQKPVSGFLLSAGILVLLFSIVKSSGFSFPSSDLGQHVNIELSRLVYAAGLIIAGFMTDKNRKYGAVCALTALMLPFIILALRGESVSSLFFWVLSYFTFGFYSVYRIILFSDIAAAHPMMALSGFGLLIGRIGDAAGEAICLLFGTRPVLLILLTALLFAAAVAVFFRLYQKLYVPEPARQKTEKERFAHFSLSHDLSSREQDVLRLLLEKKTNAEIADILSISENTVKFHVRNLLQKTGRKNRNDLVADYLRV